MARTLQLCVLLALAGLAAAGGSGWDRVTKPSKGVSSCLRRAKSCSDAARCVEYRKCGDCDYKSMVHSRCAPLPTAYQLMSSNPNFTIATALVEQLGLVGVLNGSFTGTILLPTDAAFTAYLSTMAINPLEPQYIAYLPAFLGPLLEYHVLLRRLFSWQLRPMAYSTVYMSINAIPHKVTAVYNGTCPMSARKSGGKDGDKGYWKGCTRSYYLRDEQGFNVTFAGVDAMIFGGGVVHAINSVLQPNDIYPSITAALTRNPTLFSNITAVVLAVDQALAPLNISVLNTIETTPGSMAAPVNSAFIGLDTSGLTLQYLLQTLLYHFCPASSPAAILRTPYNQPGFNPCLTALNAANPGFSTGLDYFFQLAATFGQPPTMRISYVSGAVNQLVIERTTILMADVKTPISSTVAINRIMLPPTGLPQPALP